MSDPTVVTIVGNVTRIELKYLASGMAVAEFAVAVNERVKNKDTGQWEDGDSSFFDCTVFGQMAENVVETIEQGTRVILRGRLKQDRWETDSGDKRSKVKVMVDDIGPDLRWATAAVQKIQRSSSTHQGGGQQAQPSGNPFS